MGGNTKGHEVADHVATKAEVNTRMISTLKNKIDLKHENKGKF